MSGIFSFTRIVWSESLGILADYYHDYAHSHGPVGDEFRYSNVKSGHSGGLSGR